MQSMNHKDILVAVYMITYNHELYINEAVQSILAQQTDFNFKLFIGDDCSTDKTSEIIKSLKEKFPDKIEYILNQSNLGPSKNAQNIFKKCFDSKAKYIAMCEGDDYWTDPLKLQKQVDFLEANDGFTFCGHDVAIKNEHLNSITNTFALKKNVIKLKDCVFGPPVHTSSWVFKNIEIPHEQFKSLITGDDALMCFFASKGDGYNINETMSVYRLSDAGTWSTLTQIEKDHRTLIIQLWTIQNYPVRLKDQAKQIYTLINKTKHYKSLFSKNFSNRQKVLGILSINFYRVLLFRSKGRGYLSRIKNGLQRKISNF